MPRICDPEIRNRNCQRIYGCSEAEAIALNKGLRLRDPQGLAMRFSTQKHAAKRRGIPWLLTFRAWVRIWEMSGCLAHRGVGVGRYVMARFGDVGPYSEQNVHIQLAVLNSRDGLATRLMRADSLHASIKKNLPETVSPNHP